jgi:hypothetical protein
MKDMIGEIINDNRNQPNPLRFLLILANIPAATARKSHQNNQNTKLPRRSMNSIFYSPSPLGHLAPPCEATARFVDMFVAKQVLGRLVISRN